MGKEKEKPLRLKDVIIALSFRWTPSSSGKARVSFFPDEDGVHRKLEAIITSLRRRGFSFPLPIFSPNYAALSQFSFILVGLDCAQNLYSAPCLMRPLIIIYM